MTFNYMFPIRLTQLLFSIITLGLCGYGSYFSPVIPTSSLSLRSFFPIAPYSSVSRTASLTRLLSIVAHWYLNAAGVASPGQVNFLIFNGLWTLLIGIYLIVSPVYFPRLSHKYAVLALDAVTALFWFAGFVALAVFLSTPSSCAGGVCRCARVLVVFASFLW